MGSEEVPGRCLTSLRIIDRLLQGRQSGGDQGGLRSLPKCSSAEGLSVILRPVERITQMAPCLRPASGGMASPTQKERRGGACPPITPKRGLGRSRKKLGQLPQRVA